MFVPEVFGMQQDILCYAWLENIILQHKSPMKCESHFFFFT